MINRTPPHGRFRLFSCGDNDFEEMVEIRMTTRLRLNSNLILTGVMALALTSSAMAQATRTWISGVGDDANPCSRTAPCKTFAGAISKTATGGEIDALDPGGFGAVTITKSITLDGGGSNGGQVASILVSGTNGIVINGTGIVVTIRNLDLDGLQTAGSNGGLSGVNIISAAAVHMENVAIVNGFSQNGVLVGANANTQLTMNNVTITDVSGPGVSVGTSSGNAVADLREVHIWNCAPGILGTTGSVITVQNSIVSANGSAIKQTTGGSQINVIATEMNSNGNAMLSFTGSSIRAMGNTMMQNGTAFNVGGGTIYSDGTNILAGNGTNVNGTLTSGGITHM